MSRATLTQPKKQARGRLLVLCLFAVSFGALIGLLTCEFAIRIFAPQQLVSDIVTGDNDVDYRLRPNARGRMSSPEYAVTIRVNSLGFRGEEVSAEKTPGIRRILFLGDSYTFGHGLVENEALPSVVGQELQKKLPGQYEVINGGVYGYSTANELDLFLKYGRPLKPDIVVILVMVHDMFDNPTGYTLGSNGILTKNHVSNSYTDSRRITRYIPFANWLREHSHLFKFVGIRVLPVLKSGVPQKHKTDSDPAPQNETFDTASPEFYTEKGGPFEVTQAILARLAQSAKEIGAQSLVLTLGGKDEFDENGQLKPIKIVPHQHLAQAALSSGFSGALAITPILATYPAKEKLFFPVDGHWTGAATKFVGPAIADFIVEQTRDANK